MSDQYPSAPQDPNQSQYPAPPQYPGQLPEEPRPGLGAYPPPAPSYGPPVQERPGTVIGAAVTAIVLSALSALLFGIIGLIAIVAKDEFADEIMGTPGFDGFTRSELESAASIVGVAFLVIAAWSVFTIITAALSLRQQNWARIITVVTAALWGVLGLVSLAGGDLSGLVLVAGSAAVIVLYFVGRANAWYSSKPANS